MSLRRSLRWLFTALVGAATLVSPRSSAQEEYAPNKPLAQPPGASGNNVPKKSGAKVSPANKSGAKDGAAKTGKKVDLNQSLAKPGLKPGTGTSNRAASARGEDKKGAPSSRQPSSETATAGSDAASGAAAGAGESVEAVGFVERLRRFVKAHYVAILAVLGVALAASLTGVFVSGRRRRSGEEFLEPLDSEAQGDAASGQKRRYSSTRIQASDVNARLGGTVGGTQIETDREYALVVEEEALKAAAPGPVDESTGRLLAQDQEIRELIAGRRFDEAFQSYSSRIEADGSIEFQSDLEAELSEHFIRQREFDRAARVLEHHVATHASKDIAPSVYFNLGYIHVLTQTYNKSRRFFRLFVENEKNPAHIERAQRILKSLESRH